jgi:hypothetical protein
MRRSLTHIIAGAGRDPTSSLVARLLKTNSALCTSLIVSEVRLAQSRAGTWSAC